MDSAVYYYANKEYQYSHARLMYEKLGGTFLVRDARHYFRFKWYFRHWPGIRVTFKDLNVDSLKGVILSMSNAPIRHDPSLCTTLFLGHGSGDKRYGGNARNLLSYDFLLISGGKQMAKLIDEELDIPEDKLIKVGNPRFDEYINNTIDRAESARYLGIRDLDRKTILYAPTWRWGKGSLLTHYQLFCKNLTKEFNLIIRPHFHERRLILKMKAWTVMNRIDHVYFSNPAQIHRHDTMHDFVISDLLISDTSSIAYEYLITRNPILIIETGFSDLHSMPPELDINTVAAHFRLGNSFKIESLVHQMLSQNKSSQYAELLYNCFYYNDGKSAQRVTDFIQSLPVFKLV